MKKLTLTMMVMGLVISGVSYGYDDYIELTPVPEEMIKEIAISVGNYFDFSVREGSEKMGPVYDAELIPIYTLNGKIYSYWVLMYCEETPKKPWREILDEIYPDYLTLKKYKNNYYEIMRELQTVKDEIINEEDETKKEKLQQKKEDLRERSIELSKEIEFEIEARYFRSGEYECKRYYANYEQSSSFHGGQVALPPIILGYWDVFDFLKDEFQTDNIEFSRFVVFAVKDNGGGIGYEFVVDGKSIVISGPPSYKWYYSDYLEDNLDFDRIYKDINHDKEEWMEKFEKYKRNDSDVEEYGSVDIPPPVGITISCVPNYYEPLEWEYACCHVAASNILAYHNFIGGEMEPDWGYGSGGWDSYPEGEIEYRYDNGYGQQFMWWTYDDTGLDYTPSYTEMITTIDNFTDACGWNTGNKEFYVNGYYINWIHVTDEIDGSLDIYSDDPASPIWLAAYQRDDYPGEGDAHAVSVIGYDERGNEQYLIVNDNWDYHEDEYQLSFVEDEYMIRIHPYVEPAITGSVYFAGASGPDFIELGLAAETDGEPTHWNLYRSRHRTGPFTTEPGVFVEEFWTTDDEPDDPYHWQSYRTQDYTMDDSDGYYYILEEVGTGDLYGYVPKPGWDVDPPPYYAQNLPSPPSLPTPPSNLTAQDVPDDQGWAMELNWEPAQGDNNQILLRGEKYNDDDYQYDFEIIVELDGGVNHYIDETVPCNGKTYYYIVRTDDGEMMSEDSNVAEGMSHDNRPSPMRYLTADDYPNDDGGQILISFNAPEDESEVDYYIVDGQEYDGGDTGEIFPVGIVDATGLESYEIVYDLADDDETYRFWGQSVGYNGLLSWSSNSGYGQSLDNLMPAPPTDLTANPGFFPGKIKLDWTLSVNDPDYSTVGMNENLPFNKDESDIGKAGSSALDVVSYWIYRSTTAPPPFEPPGYPNDPNPYAVVDYGIDYFIDDNVVSGQLYYYYLRSYDGTNLSYRSNVASSYPSSKSFEVVENLFDSSTPKVAFKSNSVVRDSDENLISGIDFALIFDGIIRDKSSTINTTNSFFSTVGITIPGMNSLVGVPTTFAIVKIYPNPVNDTVNVILSLPIETSVEIEIYDITGRKLLVEEANELSQGEGEVVIDTSNLPNGVYTVKAISSDKSLSIKRMVVIKYR